MDSQEATNTRGSDQKVMILSNPYLIIQQEMIRYIGATRFYFAASKGPTKRDADNPTFREKLQVFSELKPYIIPFIHPQKKVTVALLKSYGYLALSKICFFGGPMLLKFGINGLQNAAMADPFLMFFGYGVCYSSSVFFQSLRNLEITKVTSIALTQTTSKAYEHMLSLGPAFFFSTSQRTKLFNLSKAQSAIEQNIKSFTQYFLPFFLDIAICSTLLIHYADSWTMLAFISCYTFYSVFTIKYSDYRRKHIKQQRQAERKLDFISSQTFANYLNVKYFKKEKEEVLKYQNALEKYYESSNKVQVSLGILNTVQRIIFGAGITFNLMMGAYYVQKSLMSIGDVIMIQTLMMQFLSPLFFLGSTYRNFADTFVEVKELYDTMKIPSEVVEGSIEPGELKGNIVFKDVTFKYIQSSDVLEKLNFQIKSGSFVGITGESGSGKSTIFNLIFRLFDPKTGDIDLDGNNLKDLKLSYRNQITVVSQLPYLFNGTVLENLQYGNPSSTFEQIENFAKFLGLHELIMELPKNYNTNVGEKGNIFSGGQKQRISLIRALLKKSPIMLLDEPTSSLDSVMEQKIIQLLLQQKDSTRIMITHNRNLLKNMDQVIEIPKI